MAINENQSNRDNCNVPKSFGEYFSNNVCKKFNITPENKGKRLNSNHRERKTDNTVESLTHWIKLVNLILGKENEFERFSGWATIILDGSLRKYMVEKLLKDEF